jgi:mono/diheme cytochrome c family protein
LIVGVAREAAAQEASEPNLVARGSYLAKAADCMPCHTSARDKPFAGGLQLNTPFGAIYSRNITPDRETGIGAWTFEQFKDAVHAGIRADGKYLYPAMPFDAFTEITEDDLKALWAYFRTLTPIKQQNHENDMTFPFSIREGMLAWRLLFFRERFFQPNPGKSAQWNRGAYLVDALGHCGDCHTPRNLMGATIASRRFEGATIDQWYAPNITAEALAKTNRWDQSQLIAFLKQGAANNSTVLGPMQEVVHDRLPFLTSSDLEAMATYLLDVTNAKAAPAPAAKKLPAETEKSAGKLYADSCASCHQANGQGIAGSIPPLAGNPAVVAAKPFDALSVVLQGIPARDGMPAMPSFGGSMNDSGVADVVNYVRTSWGNTAAPNATPKLVAAWRSGLSLPVYASDAARRFECPDVGQGGAAALDPGLIADLGGELAKRSVAYATLVAKYKAQNPDADVADIVNNLVAAYCPVVAASAGSDQQKSLALKRFALDITSYLSNQSVVAEAEPDAGIIWAVPAGYSLAERDPGWQPGGLKCPANDKSRVPATLVAAAAQVAGKPDVNLSAPAAIGQADAMLAQNPQAKPADLANALILAYCEGVVGLAGVGDVEKSAALMRYGEQVIQELQLKVEAKERAPAAKVTP